MREVEYQVQNCPKEHFNGYYKLDDGFYLLEDGYYKLEEFVLKKLLGKILLFRKKRRKKNTYLREWSEKYYY